MHWRVWFFLFTLPLFSNELDERVAVLERQMDEVGGETPEGTYGASFAPETFQRGWVGISLYGSALYWQAKEEGGESFDWGFGYRAGLGIRLPLLGGEITGLYTHFGTGGLDYDSVDIELRSSSFLSRFFGMGTFWGGRGVWIDQGEPFHFQGRGPRIGGRLKWHLLYGASFFADVSGSLLYGERSGRHNEKAHRFAANVGLNLGVGWDVYARGYHWGVALGYEAEYFWLQGLQNFKGVDDLTFYGATLKMMVEF